MKAKVIGDRAREWKRNVEFMGTGRERGRNGAVTSVGPARLEKDARVFDFQTRALQKRARLIFEARARVWVGPFRSARVRADGPPRERRPSLSLPPGGRNQLLVALQLLVCAAQQPQPQRSFGHKLRAWFCAAAEAEAKP